MAKYVAKNIGFEVSTDGGTTWHAVPQVSTIETPQEDTEEIEVTTLDNATNTKEFLQGFSDGGSATITVVFDPASHYTPAYSMWKLRQTGDVARWRIALPDAMALNLQWDAYVKNARLAAVTPGKALTMSATLRVSGTAADFVAVTP